MCEITATEVWSSIRFEPYYIIKDLEPQFLYSESYEKIMCAVPDTILCRLGIILSGIRLAMPD